MLTDEGTSPPPPHSVLAEPSTPARAIEALTASFLLVLLLFSGCSGNTGAPSARDAVPATTASPPQSQARVLLVGLDGADWKVIRPLIEAHRMPHLASLIERGASGELRTLVPALSPSIWTTIATGVSPEKHGILEFWHPVDGAAGPESPEESEHLERLRALGYISGPSARGAARMALYRSTDRKAPAIWNILSAQGLSCDVLSWWISYPAEPIDGIMVSDRYLYNRFVLVAATRGMDYETKEALVTPAAAETRLRPLVVPVEAVSAGDLHRFIQGKVALHSGLRLHEVEDELKIAYAKDSSVVAMARALLAERMPRFFAVYIQGIDIASHYFWKYRFPADWKRLYPSNPIPGAEQARYGRVIDEYYALQDQNLGSLIALAGDGVDVIVLSDHGFVTGARPPGTIGAAQTVSGVHEDEAPPAILVMAGPHVRKGAALKDASVLDIAPTILSLYRMPAPPAMEGRVLTEALNEIPSH